MVFLRQSCILIGKNLCFPLNFSSLSANSSKVSVIFPYLYLQTPLRLFTSNTESIVDFLIASVGLAPNEAVKASRSVNHNKTLSNPDSVLRFFKQNGFTRDNIKRIVLHYPKLLNSDVDYTLKPKIEGLTKLGFSDTDIVSLVTAIPVSFKYMNYSNLLPRVEFLRNFLGSNEKIIKAFSVSVPLLSSNLESIIKPRIYFLRECQLSDAKIVSLITTSRQLLSKSIENLKTIDMRVEELGVSRGSAMYYHVFYTFIGCNPDVVKFKIKLLGRLGFQETEILSVLKKHPSIIRLSEKNLQETVDFLVKEVGCELSYVINRPTILSYSLSRRLIPRNYVLQLLKAKGHLMKKINFYNIIKLSEVKFMEKFIHPYGEKMPNLFDIYTSAIARIV